MSARSEENIAPMDREHRLIELGLAYEKMMGRASIERCNCMIRYNGGPQMPAIRWHKAFFNPEGVPIVTPDSYEMMNHNAISAIMKANGETYIGHRV